MDANDSNLPVLQEQRDGVLILTLNRPDRLNGWTSEMEDAYFDALDAAARDESVRAVVVTGAGRGFCAGADMGNLGEISKSGLERDEERRPKIHPLSFPKPLIAAVNGACAGLGLVQAVMADVRFAEPGIKLTTAFAKLGLIAEHGISWLLPRIVGISHALDLLMSSRVLLSERAYEIGLVNFISEPGKVVEEAVEYARNISDSVSPTAMSVIKPQVYRHLTADLEAALADSNDLMFQSLGAGEMAEGVAAFNERRSPRFAGYVASEPSNG